MTMQFAAVHSVAIGTKRTFTLLWSMSAFGGKADIDQVAPRLVDFMSTRPSPAGRRINLAQAARSHDPLIRNER
jgi:hypothetical protein